MSIFEDIFIWKSEEKDFQALLFYFINAVQVLKIKGGLLVKINMIFRSSINSIIKIAEQVFENCAVIRPDITNPFNSEIYMYCEKYMGTF